VRKTERFKAYVRKAGYVDYWKARVCPLKCGLASAPEMA
jgi:hypothetical protein